MVWIYIAGTAVIGFTNGSFVCVVGFDFGVFESARRLWFGDAFAACQGRGRFEVATLCVLLWGTYDNFTTDSLRVFFIVLEIACCVLIIVLGFE
eukprot:gene3024-2006_t